MVRKGTSEDRVGPMAWYCFRKIVRHPGISDSFRQQLSASSSDRGISHSDYWGKIWFAAWLSPPGVSVSACDSLYVPCFEFMWVVKFVF